MHGEFIYEHRRVEVQAGIKGKTFTSAEGAYFGLCKNLLHQKKSRIRSLKNIRHMKNAKFSLISKSHIITT